MADWVSPIQKDLGDDRKARIALESIGRRHGTLEARIAALEAAAEVICTSSTRPTTGLFDGMRIYETDTDEHLVYYSQVPAWRRPWRMPWGFIGEGASTTATNSGTTGAFADIGPSVTWTAVANRRYLLLANMGRFNNANAAITDVRFTDGSGTLLDTIGTINVAAATNYAMSGYTVWSPAAGSQTAKLRAASSTGTATVFQTSSVESRLVVVDIGPNGDPA